MAGNFTHNLPLWLGQRVAVFPYADVSGATIGYYGTLLSVVAESVHRNPDCPDAWQYRVDAAGCVLKVAGCDILPLGPLPAHGNDHGFEPLLQLHFAAPPLSDNAELIGMYRFGRIDWGHFSFRKQPQESPTYRLRISATLDPAVPSILECAIPSEWRLDEGFVRESFVAILGGDRPPDDSSTSAGG